MNKKLLETRINSVNHYVQEIENLENAKMVTEATLKDLVNSFVEFVPYKKGDILLRGNTVFKVAGTEQMGRDSRGVWVKLKVNYPNQNGGYNSGIDTTYIHISEMDSIKIIFSEPEN